MTKHIVLNNLTLDQLRRIVAARRSLPIPNMAQAGQTARDKYYKQVRDGHERTAAAQGTAIKLARDAGLTDAITLVTLQSVCEDFVIAQAVEKEVGKDVYDLLTFSVRAVLDPDSVPPKLRDYLTSLKPPPERPAPQATAGQERPERVRRSPAPAKPPRASRGRMSKAPAEKSEEQILGDIFG